MQTVAAFHSVDYAVLARHLPAKHFPGARKAVPPYFARQIKTLANMQRLQAQEMAAIPHFDAITRWVAERVPGDPVPLAFMHGECKIDNMLFDATEPRVIAVLDWELSTVSHPLFDLANLFQPFELPNALNRAVFGAPTVWAARAPTCAARWPSCCK